MNHSDNTKNPHQQAWELLPWIINGRASSAERNSVLAHISHCPDCRAEFERQSRLSAALRNDTSGATDPAPGFARLLDKIDSISVAANPEGLGKATHRSGGARTNLIMYGLAAAVVLQTGGLALLSAQLLARHPATPPAAYSTLSSPEPDVRRASIRIVPAAGMRIEELGAVLRQQQLQIVAGPSEAGVYSLASTSASVRVADQLAQLRATHGIRFAEPVGMP